MTCFTTKCCNCCSPFLRQVLYFLSKYWVSTFHLKRLTSLRWIAKVLICWSSFKMPLHFGSSLKNINLEIGLLIWACWSLIVFRYMRSNKLTNSLTSCPLYQIDSTFKAWVLPSRSSRQKYSSDQQLPEIGVDDPSVSVMLLYISFSRSIDLSIYLSIYLGIKYIFKHWIRLLFVGHWTSNFLPRQWV